ncbi:small multi-drug export protein [Caviibacter abscessus]|uniref:small multi-drug export protein n=1 Tax=Caviibacter abscessus TaxID=1766719 RepID=UPI0009E8E7B9|nr:small multi-drug export protein [Caviibacter abscessus]
MPLPGTGAWTGALAASILDMDFKKSMIYIFLGLILAGVIISILLSVVGFNLI